MPISNSSINIITNSCSFTERNNDDDERKKKRKKKRKERKKKKLSRKELIAEIALDSTVIKKDSLTIQNAHGSKKIELLVDSLRKSGIVVDAATIDSLSRHYFTDTIKVKSGVMPKLNYIGNIENNRILDSLIFAEELMKNNLEEEKVRVNIFKDSLTFGKMSKTAIILPGFGQIYNKQYWKLPILYGGVTGLAAAGVIMGNKAMKYKNRFNAAVSNQNQADIDRYYGKYKDNKTASSLLYVGAVATYMYFLADAAFNYKGVEDSKNKATYLAFMFPGAGQIYNKQYWKLPIVYGGFAAMAYIINFNGRSYSRYNRAYEDVINDRPDEFNGRRTEEQLRNYKDKFRRARDMAIFYTVGFYFVTVIEAYVAASFKQYDISDDLSLKVVPKIDYNQIGSTQRGNIGNKGSFGLSMNITF